VDRTRMCVATPMRDHQFLPAKFLTDKSLTSHELDDLEAAHLIVVPGSRQPVPFGHLHSEWLKFRRKLRDGDQLREFRTPVCWGVAVIRKDRIVHFMPVEHFDTGKMELPTPNPNDPWQFMQAGEYSTAIDAYSEQIRSTPGPPWYAGRALAHLASGQYDLAIRDYETANRLALPTCGGYRQWLATVHWVAGQHDKAQQTWRTLVMELDRGAITYTDAAGGVEHGCNLWFAGVSTGDDGCVALARSSMRRLLFRQRAKNWPGPIAAFVLDQIPEREMLSCVSDVDGLRQRQLCQALFYAAINQRTLDNESGFWERITQAVSDGRAFLEMEYFLAQAEIGRL
jgi:tetratricopeptide (TPR) repeat protein